MAKKSRRPPVSRDKRFRKNAAADTGTPERWQHGGRVMEYTETAGVFAARALEEHVLDNLLLSKMIEKAWHEAGLRLHQDYHLAGIEARLTASYASVRVAAGDAEGRLLRNDVEEAAYQRWRNALRAVPQDGRDSVIHVACIGMAPAVMQLARLQRALEKLARYYGLSR